MAKTPISSTPNKKEETKTSAKKGFLVWIILLLLAISLGAGAGIGAYYYLSKKGEEEKPSKETEEEIRTEEQKQEEEEREEENEEREENDKQEEKEEEMLVTFEGTCVSAEIPKDWKIKEYLNGDGSNMLTEEVTYTGCTGLKVLNHNGEMVFELKAVDGIGGLPVCKEFYHFADTDPSYQTTKIEMSAEEGITTTVIDLSATPYTQFDFLGKKVRRIDTQLYVDTSPGPTFDAACGLEANVWTIPEISFTADGIIEHTYEPKITPGTPEPELKILEAILKSMK